MPKRPQRVSNRSKPSLSPKPVKVTYLWFFAFVIVATPLYLWLRQIPPQMIATTGTCKAATFQFRGIGVFRTEATALQTFGFNGKLENALETTLDGMKVDTPNPVTLEASQSVALPSSLQIHPSGRLGILIVAVSDMARLTVNNQDTKFSDTELRGSGIGVMVESERMVLSGARYKFAGRQLADFVALAANSGGLVRLSLGGSPNDDLSAVARLPSKGKLLDISLPEGTPISLRFDDCKRLQITSNNKNILGAGVSNVSLTLASWPHTHNQIWSDGSFTLDFIGTATSVNVYDSSVLKNNAELIKDDPVSKHGIVGIILLGFIWLGKETIERIGKQLAAKIVPEPKELDK